jgi:1-acyl-sn-glycerol-3-phosphate acyltransferase
MISFLFFLTWLAWIVVATLLAWQLTWWAALLALILSIPVGFGLNLVIFALWLHLYGALRPGIERDNILHHKFLDGFLVLVIRLLRFHVHASGLKHIPQDDPFVFVGNHQSNYDTIIHKVLLPNPLVFIAKEAIFRWIIIGPIARLMGHVSMHREKDREAVKALLEGIKVFESGMSVGIYPEGTRSKKNSMLPFKPGALKLAIKPGAPVLVGVIYNTINAWKQWPLKKQHVYVHYFPIIPKETVETMTSNELSDHIRALIQSKLDEYQNRGV